MQSKFLSYLVGFGNLNLYFKKGDRSVEKKSSISCCLILTLPVRKSFTVIYCLPRLVADSPGDKLRTFLDHGWSNFPIKNQVKYFQLCGLYGFHGNYSSLPITWKQWYTWCKQTAVCSKRLVPDNATFKCHIIFKCYETVFIHFFPWSI